MKPNRRSGADGRNATLNLDKFLPYRLSVLANTISSDLASRYATRFGLTIPQWRVMAVLGDDPERSAVEIAARTRMDKVTVSRAVAALLERGDLRRRTDPTDRRRSVLRLTGRGRRIYAQIVPLARAYESELLERLEPRDRGALDRLIEHLDRVARELANGAE